MAFRGIKCNAIIKTTSLIYLESFLVLFCTVKIIHRVSSCTVKIIHRVSRLHLLNLLWGKNQESFSKTSSNAVLKCFVVSIDTVCVFYSMPTSTERWGLCLQWLA